MDCPRDHATLNPFRQGKYPRYECPMCTGMLVLEKDLMLTLGYKDDRRFEAVAKVKVANVKDSDLACPQDGATLKAVKYMNTDQGRLVSIHPASCRATDSRGANMPSARRIAIPIAAQPAQSR